MSSSSSPPPPLLLSRSISFPSSKSLSASCSSSYPSCWLPSSLPPSFSPSFFFLSYSQILTSDMSRLDQRTHVHAHTHESPRPKNWTLLQSVVASALDGQDRAWIAAQQADKRAFVAAEANSKLRTENVRLKKFIELRQDKIGKDAARSVLTLTFLSPTSGRNPEDETSLAAHNPMPDRMREFGYASPLPNPQTVATLQPASCPCACHEAITFLCSR